MSPRGTRKYCCRIGFLLSRSWRLAETQLGKQLPSNPDPSQNISIRGAPRHRFALMLRQHLILLLISPDFMDSDYCYRREMRAALKRHAKGQARVIPIILRPVDWRRTPIGRLLALPRDGKPVTTWHRRDEALLDVAKGVRMAAEEVGARRRSNFLSQAHGKPKIRLAIAVTEL